MKADHAPTIAQALAWAKSQLGESESPDLDARLLLAHCLEKPRVYLHTWPERILSDAQWRQFQALLGARVAGHPIAHLLGYRDFWSLRLSVNAHTLIPRPETELLVETALELCAKAQARVLDLGTGTGAIALALATERPTWQIVGVDVKAEAVALASENARRHQLDNVRFCQSHWFDAIDQTGFDLIVSNPPYVDPASPFLTQGDVRFEPKSALVADDAGMADLLHIIAHAPRYLADDAHLLLEHGYDQGDKVRAILQQHGYSPVCTMQDLAGHERVSYGQWRVTC